jgi:hypothetical protein
MKRCPACGTTYTDATLTFCLADGSRLEETLDSDPTLISGKEKMRVDIPSTVRTPPRPVHTEPPAKSSAGTWVKVFLGIFALGVLLIAVIGIAGAVFYFSSGTATSGNNAVAVKSPTPAPSPTVDEEKKRLEDELANVQRRLDETKKAATPNTNPFPDSNTDADPSDSLAVATVNSPNDGFLALRTEPDPDTGTRIAKIPHGAQVVVAMCQDARVTIGGRTGKWCLVGWDNYVGWVFDPFLTYSAKN